MRAVAEACAWSRELQLRILMSAMRDVDAKTARLTRALAITVVACVINLSASASAFEETTISEAGEGAPEKCDGRANDPYDGYWCELTLSSSGASIRIHAHKSYKRLGRFKKESCPHREPHDEYGDDCIEYVSLTEAMKGGIYRVPNVPEVSDTTYLLSRLAGKTRKVPEAASLRKEIDQLRAQVRSLEYSLALTECRATTQVWQALNKVPARPGFKKSSPGSPLSNLAGEWQEGWHPSVSARTRSIEVNSDQQSAQSTWPGSGKPSVITPLGATLVSAQRTDAAKTPEEAMPIQGELLHNNTVILWSNGFYWNKGKITDKSKTKLPDTLGLYRTYITPSTGELFCLMRRQAEQGESDWLIAYPNEPEDGGPRERKADVSSWSGARRELKAQSLSQDRLLLWEDGRYSWAP